MELKPRVLNFHFFILFFFFRESPFCYEKGFFLLFQTKALYFMDPPHFCITQKGKGKREKKVLPTMTSKPSQRAHFLKEGYRDTVERKNRIARIFASRYFPFLLFMKHINVHEQSNNQFSHTRHNRTQDPFVQLVTHAPATAPHTHPHPTPTADLTMDTHSTIQANSRWKLKWNTQATQDSW